MYRMNTIRKVWHKTRERQKTSQTTLARQANSTNSYNAIYRSETCTVNENTLLNVEEILRFIVAC